MGVLFILLCIPLMIEVTSDKYYRSSLCLLTEITIMNRLIWENKKVGLKFSVRWGEQINPHTLDWESLSGDILHLVHLSLMNFIIWTNVYSIQLNI